MYFVITYEALIYPFSVCSYMYCSFSLFVVIAVADIKITHILLKQGGLAQVSEGSLRESEQM